MAKIAFVFPGQGTQYKGMGKTLYESSDVFKRRVEEANALLPYDLKNKMFDSESIHETASAQVALYVMQCALADVLIGEGVMPDGAAGLSIGEYAALYVNRVFDFERGLNIVAKRGELMQASAQKRSSGMMAMLGTMTQARAIENALEDVFIANHTMKKQVVFGGGKEALEKAQALGKELGIRRFILLKTNAAFHTSYMSEARDAFSEYLKDIVFHSPQNALYLNTTGALYKSQLKTTMINQITSPVLFYPMIKTMIEDGYTHFIELGPRATLSSFIRKTDKRVFVLADVETQGLDMFLNTLRSELHE